MAENAKTKRLRMLIRQLWGWWLVLLVCGIAILMGLAALDPPPWKWETAQITVAGIADYRTMGVSRGRHINRTVASYAKAEMITASDGNRYWLEDGMCSLVVGGHYTVSYFERGGLRVIRGATQGDNPYEDFKGWLSMWKGDQIFRTILLLALAGVIVIMVREFCRALDNVRILEYQESVSRTKKESGTNAVQKDGF